MNSTHYTYPIAFTFKSLTLLFLLLLPFPAFSESVTLQIPIPELDAVQTCQGALCSGIGLYIAAFAKWLVAAIALLAVIALMIAGIAWLTAAGSTQRITFAKKLITDTLWAVACTLGSYLILFTINPNLVQFGEVGGIEKVEKINFQPIEVLEDNTYNPSIDTGGSTGQAQSVGVSGTKGGSPVAKDGLISMTLVESKTLRGIKIASSVVDSLDSAIMEIRKTYPNFKFVGGIGQSNRNGNSCHINGLSIDINPDQNPCGSDCLKYPGEHCCWGKRGVKIGSGEFKPYQDTRSHTKEIVAIMQKHGWCWGGNWRTFRDLHHFARCSKDCADVRVYQFPSH